MNQAILFNDDLAFDEASQAWKMSGILAGELILVYFHSPTLKHTVSIDNCMKYDLEEITELWLEQHEPENGEIHIY